MLAKQIKQACQRQDVVKIDFCSYLSEQSEYAVLVGVQDEVLVYVGLTGNTLALDGVWVCLLEDVQAITFAAAELEMGARWLDKEAVKQLTADLPKTGWPDFDQVWRWAKETETLIACQYDEALWFEAQVMAVGEDIVVLAECVRESDQSVDQVFLLPDKVNRVAWRTQALLAIERNLTIKPILKAETLAQPLAYQNQLRLWQEQRQLVEIYNSPVDKEGFHVGQLVSVEPDLTYLWLQNGGGSNGWATSRLHDVLYYRTGNYYTHDHQQCLDSRQLAQMVSKIPTGLSWWQVVEQAQKQHWWVSLITYDDLVYCGQIAVMEQETIAIDTYELGSLSPTRVWLDGRDVVIVAVETQESRQWQQMMVSVRKVGLENA